MATLVFETPPQASVELDGRLVTDRRQRVDPGPHHVASTHVFRFVSDIDIPGATASKEYGCIQLGR
jgi:hypothetical protein